MLKNVGPLNKPCAKFEKQTSIFWEKEHPSQNDQQIQIFALERCIPYFWKRPSLTEGYSAFGGRNCGTYNLLWRGFTAMYS